MKYETPLAMFIMIRMTKIHTSNCTCTMGLWTPRRMKVIKATPVIADIGSDLMKIVFKIKEDDARNPGVIEDCTGDKAGDSVGPSADGFETYGGTGVALITFILLAVKKHTVQRLFLVCRLLMRAVTVTA